jgi:glucokinase
MHKEITVDPQNLPLVIGVDLGGTQLRVAVLQGVQRLSRISVPTGKESAPDYIIPRIYSAIQKALDEADKKLEQIVGIGIGVAGPLDSHSGIVFSPPNLSGWNHVPLKTIFEEHYALPIFIENDANVAALGEYMFGAGRECKDMIYLTVSTGIGGGVIVNGQLMEGTSGTAGELGHMTIDWRGEQCNCGNIGCLESIASGTAIARRAREAMKRGVDFFAADSKDSKDHTVDNVEQMPQIDAEIVAQAAKRGLPEACEIINDAAEALGIGMVNLIHIFNPNMIVLGGGLMQMGSLLINPALRIVEKRAMAVPGKAVQIVNACLGVDTGLIGAGALVYLREKGMSRSGEGQPEWSFMTIS